METVLMTTFMILYILFIQKEDKRWGVVAHAHWVDRKVELCEFKDSLVYLVNSEPVKVT